MHVCVDCTGPADRSSVWRNHAPRRVVDPAAGGVPRTCPPSSSTRRGRRSRASLHVRPVPLARSTRPNSSATRRTAGSVRSPPAGPAWLPFSPALLILPIPGLFRLTCYYYRGAYYKAFWMDPPSCTVGEPRKSYWGENSFPLVLQNAHRYMLFLSLARAGDPVAGRLEGALVRRPGDRHRASFGIGVGTLVLAANCVLLSSLPARLSLAASRRWRLRRSLSQAPLGLTAYSCVSCLNRRHMLWAWCSLFSVGFSDLYVRLCSMGVWSDLRIF